MALTDDERNDQQRSWLGHPYTRKLLADQKARVEQATTELMSAAVGSTDPKVRGAYCKLVEVKAMALYLDGDFKP